MLLHDVKPATLERCSSPVGLVLSCRHTACAPRGSLVMKSQSHDAPAVLCS